MTSSAKMLEMHQRRILVFILAALSALVIIGVGLHYYTRRTATPRKIAEGTYSVSSSDPASPTSRADVDSFTLWTDPNGHLRTVIALQLFGSSARDPTRPFRQTEVLELNSDLSMRRLRFELENTKISGDGALDCSVGPFSLDCVSTFEDDKGKGSIQATGSYATQFGAEIAVLDFPWFFTTLAAHSKRNSSGSTPLKAVTIAFDGQTPDTLVTGRVVEAKAEYLGTDVIQILDHATKAHKFHMSGGRSRDLPDLESTVWVSDSGLLLALDWMGEHWELTRFLQREKLIPELPVDDDKSK